MDILVLENVLVGGIWHEPGIGRYDSKLGQHLIDIGVARPVEAKIEKPPVITKDEKKTHSSVSQQDQASQIKTAKKRKRSKR